MLMSAAGTTQTLGEVKFGLSQKDKTKGLVLGLICSEVGSTHQ